MISLINDIQNLQETTKAIRYMREHFVEAEKVKDKEDFINNYQGDPFEDAYKIILSKARGISRYYKIADLKNDLTARKAICFIKVT